MDKILYVEDTQEAVLILKNTLREYNLHVCSTLKEAGQLITENQYKMIIIDIELPDGRGHELMPLLQKNLHQTSVLFLTSHSDFHEKLTAFSLGAFDYVQKPFDPRELKLRVDAQIRRMNTQEEENQVIKIGGLTCNLEEQKIYINKEGKKAMDLTGIEFKIFKLLSKTPKKVFPREAILEKIWGDSITITPRTVDVHISNLRRKLTDTDVSILHKHGHGYYILSSPSNPSL